MLSNTLRVLWGEPRPSEPEPPGRRVLDWLLVGGLVGASVLEVLLREDPTWWPVVLVAALATSVTLLWRRTHPLAAALVAFGALTAVDLARILTAAEVAPLWSTAGVLLLPFALFRWGAGREAALGLGAVVVWLGVTHLVEPAEPAEVVAGFGFFLLSAALGASIRYHANAGSRAVEEAKLRQRNQLARELHDTVGHHMSAIAIQAQAGRMLGSSDPARAMTALEAIEEAASRTLEEMRVMLAILRDGAGAELAPRPGVADIEHLARDGGRDHPRVVVRLAADLEGLSPPVATALYRLAQESVTNATRHARDATRVVVDVRDEGDRVRLTVRDDGAASPPGPPGSGFGLRGMAERIALLRGTFHAGPAPDRGWAVDAVLPKGTG